MLLRFYGTSKLIYIEGEDKVPHQRDEKSLQDERACRLFLCLDVTPGKPGRLHRSALTGVSAPPSSPSGVSGFELPAVLSKDPLAGRPAFLR